MISDVEYARSGDVLVAYQVVGAGPLDLVLAHGWAMAFELGWEEPHVSRFYQRLASQARLILFDARGTGMSDRVSMSDLPDLETRMDDVRAVMDAAGSERAALFGIAEAGAMSMLFAATYPERATALILMTPSPRGAWAPDWPTGTQPGDLWHRLGVDVARLGWRRELALEYLRDAAPTLLGDKAAEDWWVRSARRTLTPAANTAYDAMVWDTDIRDVLPAVRVPTLVLCPSDDEEYLQEARYTTDRIPGAALVEFPGTDRVPWGGDQDVVLPEVERFLAALREEMELDRVLATVLFTDIVGSTEIAARLGDRAWRAVIADHDRIVRAQLARYRGREVARTGDGFLATFDGPARGIRCACAIVRQLHDVELESRAGLHTGELELAGEDVRGIAVHVAARVSGEAAPGEVLVSATVKDLVAGSGLGFEARGERVLKGVPEPVKLYSVA